jgi:hypothetical protein
MKATLDSGVQVPVFSDFYEAEDSGLLSRSAWRKQGRLVPKETIPSGVVVMKQMLLKKSDKEVVVPILGKKGEDLVIAVSWVDVFRKEQTETPNKPELSETIVNSASLEQESDEEAGGSSLMTQNASQDIALKQFTTSIIKKDKSTVNTVRAYVPEGLVLPDNCPCKEQIYWFLGLLYWKHLEQRLPWGEPIPLMYDHLKANIPDWPAVWRWCDGWLVHRDRYSVGEKAYGYWTAMPYQEQTHRLRTFQHAGLAKRLRAIERKHLSRPIMAHLRKQLDRLSVDMDKFHDLFATNPNRHYYQAHLQTILDGELRLTADDFSGRLHSNVSNMYKPLRALLRVDGESDTLGETDIKNSQPLFLGLAAKEKGIEDNKYMRLCEEGQIYDHMAGRLGVLRESAKHEIVMFFFAKNGFKSTAKSVFEMEFPKMAAFIRKVKASDYKRLARQMQIAERKFVIDTVCERLKRLKTGDVHGHDP